MNKRDFIAGASAGALAAVALPSTAGAVPATTSRVSNGPVAPRRLPPVDGRQSLAAWQRYVGQVFSVGSSATMRLAAVQETPHAGRPLEQFKLSFELLPGTHIVDGAHELRHATGQRFSLDLESTGPGRAHALFSLLV